MEIDIQKQRPRRTESAAGFTNLVTRGRKQTGQLEKELLVLIMLAPCRGARL